jgi:hypothetical protein
LNYYRLISIEGPRRAPADTDDDGVKALEPDGFIPNDKDEKHYTVKVLKLDDKKEISANMFRMSIFIKTQEYLEYIGGDTAGRKPFPFTGSVAGLALRSHQTIVMDRDKNTRFRTTEDQEGICPVDVEQQRGLKEIAYLSFISIPIITESGNPWETTLGIMSASTRLFAVKAAASKTLNHQCGESYRVKARLSALTEMANLIYDQDDASVHYLEGMRTVIVPLLELYLRCRQGAT